MDFHLSYFVFVAVWFKNLLLPCLQSALAPPQRPALKAGRLLDVCPPSRSAGCVSRLLHRSPEPVNLVEGLCSQVTYIAWDSAGARGAPNAPTPT